MANTTIDTSELEYLKSCRDKLRDIAVIINEEKEKNEEGKSSEDKLKEIKKVIKNLLK